LGFSREGGSYTAVNDNVAIDNNTSTALGANFNIGYAALQSEAAKVIVGFNNFVGMEILDKIGSGKSDNVIYAAIQPNILGELAITPNLSSFAGAANGIVAGFGDADRLKDTHQTLITMQAGTAAFVGIRYQRTRWAVEAQVETDNLFAPLAGNNNLASLGGFINF
jgi:hypothetical protein